MSELAVQDRGGAFTWGVPLLGLALLVPAPGWAQTPAYVGKVCIVSTVTTRQSGPVTPQVIPIQLDATNLGANVYAVSGAVTTGESPFVLTGTAIVVGGDLYFNMTTTQQHPDGWRDTGVNQTRLNLSTMQGTFYEIGHDFSTATGTFDNSRYTAGTVSLSLSACQ